MESKKSTAELMGDKHVMISTISPLGIDDFLKTDEQKMEFIEQYSSLIMEKLGFGVIDDGLSSTLFKFAKKDIKALFYCLDATCEHYFSPLAPYAHVGFVAKQKDQRDEILKCLKPIAV